MKRAIAWIAVSSKVQAEEDKISLPEQTRLIEDYCERSGYTIVDRLSVPGHSRSETDIITALEELAAQGCTAYHRLREHWKARDFDCLLAFDSSRIGRSLSLVTWVFENTLKAGAFIQLIQGGRFDAENADIGIAMCAISATSGIQRLVRMQKAAMDQRVRRGFPTSSGILISHKLIRDDRYRPVKLVVNEAHRHIWETAARLLIEGMLWIDLPPHLPSNPGTGKPWPFEKLRRVFHHPTFWGNSARHFTYHVRHSTSLDLWAIEPGHDTPEGIQIYYGTHEPVFPPDHPLRDPLLARLRALSLVRGKRRRPATTGRFSGLLICHECGAYMTKAPTRSKYRAYLCPNANRNARAPCTNRRTINEKILRAWLGERLQKAIETGILSLDAPSRANSLDTVLAGLERQLARENDRARLLIQQRLDSTQDELNDIYAGILGEINATIKSLKSEIERLRAQQLVNAEERRGEKLSLEKIASMRIEGLWALPEHECNQVLHRLLGQRRLLIKGIQIVGHARVTRIARRRLRGI